ncbi:MAG: DUF4136 domain-containing protein [Sphingomonadales bacterium]|nr:MAG: DUF4136 domain-containing protein [Sphingomonadales bacterium]
MTDSLLEYWCLEKRGSPRGRGRPSQGTRPLNAAWNRLAASLVTCPTGRCARETWRSPVTKPFTLALLAGAALLGGCTATTRNGPIDVTRYHLGQPITERTTVAVEPIGADATVSPEYQLYADAVRAELQQLGYVPGGIDMASGYIAAVGFVRTSRGAYRERPPVTIGLGGGSYGGGRRGGVGVGGDVAFGIGGKTRELYMSELSVQLRRRSDNTTIWEGRAITESAGDQPVETAARLARALFKGFPGESGVTITVK